MFDSRTARAARLSSRHLREHINRPGMSEEDLSNETPPPGWGLTGQEALKYPRTFILPRERIDEALATMDNKDGPDQDKRNASACLQGVLTNNGIAADVLSIEGAAEILLKHAEAQPPTEFTNNCKNMLGKMDPKTYVKYADAYENRVATNKDMGYVQ